MSVFPVFVQGKETVQGRIAIYPVFTRIDYNCELNVLVIDSDGRFYCSMMEYDFSGICELIKNRQLGATVREGERVLVTDVETFVATDVGGGVEEEELIKELGDIVQELNGRPTSSDLCRAAYKDYLHEPSERNRLRLKDAYERVPKHLDYCLLGFDEKDIPIRREDYRRH